MSDLTETISVAKSLGRKLPGGAVIFTVSAEGGDHVRARLYCPDGMVEVERTDEDLIASDPWRGFGVGDDGPPVLTDRSQWCGVEMPGGRCNRPSGQPHRHHLITDRLGYIVAVMDEAAS